MSRSLAAVILVAITLSGGCSHRLSAEDEARVQSLTEERDVIHQESVKAQAEHAKLGDRELKRLIAIRVEILKTTEALIEQRIQAVESGTTISIKTIGTSPDLDLAAELEDELTDQGARVVQAEAGAAGAVSRERAEPVSLCAATESNSLALLWQRYLIARYGLLLPAINGSSGSPASTAIQ